MHLDNQYRKLNRIELYLKPKQLLLKLFFFALLYYSLRLLKSPFKIGLFASLLKPLYDMLSREKHLERSLKIRLFKVAKQISVVKKELDKEFTPILVELENDEFSKKSPECRHLILPKKGLPKEVILSALDTVDEHLPNEGRVSGALYMDLRERPFHQAIYDRITGRNPMHNDLWPGLQDKENQTIEMCLNLFNAPKNAFGMMTGGGTISIFMACLAARNRSQQFFFPEIEPEIIVSDRAHPAFKKACEILGISLITVKTDPNTFKIDLNALKDAITPHTIMLVASAPAFPEGIIDDVAAVAKMAHHYDILCHVDCCLGGFLLPFAEEADLAMPPYDFSVLGVTSLSADTHKYGLSEKGSSCVFFYDFAALGQYATFTDLESKMGMYASLGLEGSRPVRVDAWACLLATGKEGYVANLRAMLEMKDAILKGIESIEGIHVSGEPLLPIFAIRADHPKILNALLIASKMREKDWIINGLPSPPGFHFCITPTHIQNKTFVEDFLSDLRDATDYATKHFSIRPKGTLGMYEMFANKIPQHMSGPLLEEVGKQYLGILASAKRRFSHVQ
jgi:glutamate/tyrosine decarboxylase-like PLP-dependent enzyme